MENEVSKEFKPVKVRFGEEDRTYEFKHAIIHGVENNDNDRLMSLIYGYTDINDFVMVYANILIECYQFLQENYEDDENINVLDHLRNYTMNIFEGIENGEFENSEKIVERL